jgi:hypothetical protein
MVLSLKMGRLDGQLARSQIAMRRHVKPGKAAGR